MKFGFQTFFFKFLFVQQQWLRRLRAEIERVEVEPTSVVLHPQQQQQQQQPSGESHQPGWKKVATNT